MFMTQQLNSLVKALYFVLFYFSLSCVFSYNILLYDPLDEAASTNANGGSVTNINYSTGKYGNAASFSSGSSITYDTEQPFNIYKGTISMWVKPNFDGADLTTSEPLLTLKLKNGGYFRLYIYAYEEDSACLSLRIKDDNGTGKDVTSADTSIGLESSGNGVRNWTSGNWYYVQASWDLTDTNRKVSLRIDDNAGEDTTSMSGLNLDNCLINNILNLGVFEFGSGYFDGSIDEFKYTDSYIGTNKAELMLHDTFETLDKMTDVNNAVADGVSLYTRKVTNTKAKEVPRDLAVYINDSDSLYYPLISGKNCPEDFDKGTVEFWFKPDWNGSEYTENKYLLNLRTTDNYEQIYIYFSYSSASGNRYLVAKYQEDSSTKRTIEIQDSDIIDSIISDQWYHIKYYWDCDTNKTELYLNGELVGQYSGTVNELDYAPNKLYIGSVSSGEYQADGCFDDVKLYSNPHDSSFPEIFRNEPQAIPAYHSMSLYWDIPFGGTLDSEYNCTIQYKKNSESTWLNGLDLVWHPFDHEFKGSVIHLAPDTVYDFKLSSDDVTKIISMKTMCEPDNLPVNSTTILSSSTTKLDYPDLTSGTALGYNVYDGQNTATISGNLNPAVRFMDRSYIILKNFIIDGAKTGINIRGNCKNVILQNITFRNVNFEYEDSGVASKSSSIIWIVALKTTDETRVRRLTIEKCKIENLNYSANTWFEYHPDPSVNKGYTSHHPAGSCAVLVQSGMEKQLVIRYNEFGSSDGNFYDDVLQAQGGGGFGEDADIYGNYLEYAADDGIEPDEGGMNTRIYGNYISNCLVGISSQSMIYSPLYVFRNIYEKVANVYATSEDTSYSGVFAKTGPGCDWMEDMEHHYSMEYWFNNTVLNRDSEGVYKGLAAIAGHKTNIVIKNNIVECRETPSWAISVHLSNEDNIDYNFCNTLVYPTSSNSNGTTDTSFSGFYSNLSYWNSTTGEANTFIDSSSDGYDQAVKINNFTTYFDSGDYPDAGVMDHEKNNNMKFGRNASSYYVSGKWFD